MQNLEFKAELMDISLARLGLRSLGARRTAMIEQADTYFRVPNGRLKRREASIDGTPEPAEFIFYERHDRPQPRISRFEIMGEDVAAERFGAGPLPVWLRVDKSRELWMYEQVRVHLDDVKDLGRFFEIEAIVTPKQNIARCHEIVNEIRTALSPALGEAVGVGYADLIERQTPD